MLNPCFVIQYFVSFLVYKDLAGGERAGCFLGAMWLLSLFASSSRCCGFGCCPFLGSVSLFVDAPIVFGGLVLGPCFILQYDMSFAVLQSSRVVEESTGCFTCVMF